MLREASLGCQGERMHVRARPRFRRWPQDRRSTRLVFRASRSALTPPWPATRHSRPRRSRPLPRPSPSQGKADHQVVPGTTSRSAGDSLRLCLLWSRSARLGWGRDVIATELSAKRACLRSRGIGCTIPVKVDQARHRRVRAAGMVGRRPKRWITGDAMRSSAAL